MLKFDINKRIILENIIKDFYHFKNQKEFQNEFDFHKGKLLGEGAFGLVKKCTS